MNLAITGGVSEEAQFVDEQIAGQPLGLQDSIALGRGRQAAKEALYTIAEECAALNWDGYEAEPVSDATYGLAYRFLEALPLGTPMPTVGAEPDGQITFEWHRSADWTLSVSVDPEGKLHYSALLGASKVHGEEPFFGEIPERILEIISLFDRS